MKKQYLWIFLIILVVLISIFLIFQNKNSDLGYSFKIPQGYTKQNYLKSHEVADVMEYFELNDNQKVASISVNYGTGTFGIDRSKDPKYSLSQINGNDWYINKITEFNGSYSIDASYYNGKYTYAINLRYYIRPTNITAEQDIRGLINQFSFK